MASFDGLEVDVGDKKTLEVVTSDSAGNKLPSVEVEVEVVSPSGEAATYDKSDMRQSETAAYLEVLFEEAGFWHVRIEITNAGGQETDAGFIRAVSREREEMSLLTMEVWEKYLTEQALQEGPGKLQTLVQSAEERVIERYRETTPHASEAPILDAAYDADIRLDGWVEDEDGEPDLEEMDAELLDAIRRVVATLVDHEAGSPDRDILRVEQGEREVEYNPDAGELPADAFLPLTSFDIRTRYFF